MRKVVAATNFNIYTIQRLLVSLPIILFSLSVHEFAHAYVSWKLGDPTAERAGRLTLQPWAHLDPIGTLMLIISTLSGFGFGWAKPVPINPANYRNPVKGTFLVSLAGPSSNLVLAAAFAVLFRLMPNIMEVSWAVGYFIFYGVAINLGLFLFNLIPVPPLDGSGILVYFLRGRLRESYERLRPFGLLILLALIFTDVLSVPFRFLLRLLIG